MTPHEQLAEKQFNIVKWTLLIISLAVFATLIILS